MQPFQLDTTFVALNDSGGARPLPVTPDFWQALQNGGLGEFSRMIAVYAFDRDWTTWEKHPAGVEVVCLLEGHVDLVLAHNDSETIVTLNRPGAYVLVPADTWHTARTRQPCRMLFITPGEGTQNKSV